MSTVTLIDRFCSVEEAAEIIGCTDGRVRQLLRAGELDGKKVSERAWVVVRASAVKYAASQQPTGRPRNSFRRG